MNNRFFSILIILLLALLITQPSFSQDLGTIGKTYKIAEQDFLEFIQQRLEQLKNNGEMKKLQNKMVKEAKERIDHPAPIAGLTKATKNRSWLFDPTLTVNKDITDQNGNVLIKAGTTANPLDTISLTKTLIFYDADDKKQIAWARKLDQQLQGKTKLIMVNGSVFDQVKLFQKAIYFDQGGKLTTHFNIQNTPATVKQVESVDEAGKKVKRLKVSEFIIP